MDNSSLKKAVTAAWKKTAPKPFDPKKPVVKLHEATYDDEEIWEVLQCLLKTEVTMGPKVKKFEQEFAKRFGHGHAVMVNSGSSANLLAIAGLANEVTDRRHAATRAAGHIQRCRDGDRPRGSSGRHDCGHRFELVEPFQHRKRQFERRAGIERRLQQPPRLVHLAVPIRKRSGVEQLFGFTLALCLRAARAFDVRARACVTAIEEQHAGPDVDRVIVMAGEVVIEPCEKQLLDPGVAVGGGRAGEGIDRIGAKRLSHQLP